MYLWIMMKFCWNPVESLHYQLSAFQPFSSPVFLRSDKAQGSRKKLGRPNATKARSISSCEPPFLNVCVLCLCGPPAFCSIDSICKMNLMREQRSYSARRDSCLLCKALQDPISPPPPVRHSDEHLIGYWTFESRILHAILHIIYA